MRSPHHNPPDQKSHRWVVPGISIFLVAITWIVFGQTLRHDFVGYDDRAYIHDRPEIVSGLTLRGIGAAFTHHYVSNWAPLTAISHMLDCQLFGLKAGGHHFTNVLLHTIAVVLLFLVLRQMTGALWRSAFVAALFAIHPLHAESVAWVSERKDVLSGVFFMLTLSAYVHYVRNPSLVRYVTMSILYALGLLSKPMVVTVPCVLLLLDYWPLQRVADLRTLRRMVLEKIPLFLIGAASSVATAFVQAGALSSLENAPLSLRISNAFVSIITYGRQTFWPVRLAAFYPYPLDKLPAWIVALSIELIVAISVAAVIVGRRRKYIPVGWFWYLGMLVPVLGIIQVGIQGHADRYTYLPQIGLGVLITWGIVDLGARWRYRSQILGVGAAIVVVALMWCARIQAEVWRDTKTLWTHAVGVDPRNHLAHAMLGEIALAENRLGESIAHLQTALKIYPDNSQAENKLGLALMRAGDPSAAIAHWKIALEIEPQEADTECNLAWVFATCPNPFMRDGRRAVELMEDVIQQSGVRNAILLHTLAAAYAEAGRFEDAINTAQEALQLANAKGNSGLAAGLQANIDDFRMKLPVRDPSLANAQPLP